MDARALYQMAIVPYWGVWFRTGCQSVHVVPRIHRANMQRTLLNA